MYRFHYFIKPTSSPAWYCKKFQCVRVPEGDPRIRTLGLDYGIGGWCIFIAHPFKPTLETEIFELQKKFQGWDSEFEICDIDDDKELK
jgi:hypothetical protein